MLNFFSRIKEALVRILKKENISAVSGEMQTASETWHDIYMNDSVWLHSSDRDIISLRLASAISREFSRLVLSESVIEADENSPYYQIVSDFMTNLDDKFEVALAFGGLMFKPYISKGKIFIDMIQADRFLPVSYFGNSITSAVFVSKKTIGKVYYTLLEYHEYNVEKKTHTITNKLCKSANSEYIGAECGLDEVPEWSGLAENIVFSNVEKPLFSYFRVPSANNIDIDSPLGVSVYADAVDLIRQADEQWARIEWEYESKETALDVSVDMMRNNSIPQRKKRIYRQYDVDSLDGNFFNVFSPEIRDSSMFSYFNRILQRIEFNCGLAYGTLSDPQTVEKTAEEIKTSKQRSYTTVSAIQRSLEAAIQNMMYAVEVYAYLGGITSEKAEVTCTWGDSVLEDTEKEFQRRLQMVTAGLLTKEKFIAWYFHCSEEKASEYIPQTDSLFGGA